MTATLAPRQSYVIMGLLATPGIATVRGVHSPRKWDTPQGYGTDGASARYIGSELAKFDVEIKIFGTAAEEEILFAQWYVFAAAVLKKPINGAPLGPAFDVIHPVINGQPWNILSCVVEDVTQWVKSDTGLWTCTIKLLEYRPPKPALARPIATIPAAKVTPPVAQTEADVIKEQLLVQVKAKGGGF